MGIRLDESDEYMHELGPEPNFNESMYVNCFDHEQGVGGWFRTGNRANEGQAEMSVCLFLPPAGDLGADASTASRTGAPASTTGRAGGSARGRTVAFMFRRPSIDDNERLAAGGMTWTMVTPFEELRVDYEGTVLLLDDPEQMADPRAAFRDNPHVDAAVHLTFTGQGRRSMIGGELDESRERPGEEFARGHYEQLVAGSGTIRVGEREWEIAGFGLRDHSWGPRSWQAPWYYRWLTGNVDGDLGFMASRVARRDGPGTRGGFVWEDGEMHRCDDVRITTETRGPDDYHDRIEATLRSSRSGREWRVSGRVLDLIPLRNRRRAPDGEHLLTRISEAYTEWIVGATDGPGRTGFGMSEYLDQIVDGRPVGRQE